MMQKKWLSDLSVYLAWFLIVALLFWITLQLRTAIETGLSAYYIHGNFMQLRTADVIDKYSFAALICAWIIVIILIEAYLRNGAKKRALIKRFTRIFGPAALFLFMTDLFNLLMLDSTTASWTRWLALAVEFLIGGAITYYGFVHLNHKVEPQLRQS